MGKRPSVVSAQALIKLGTVLGKGVLVAIAARNTVHGREERAEPIRSTRGVFKRPALNF